MPTLDSSRSAFADAFSAESDPLLRFCSFRISDKEQALDIVQEAFLRFWQKLQCGTTIYNARAFLFTVCHNLIIDWYRKKKYLTLQAYTADGEEELDPPDEATAGNGLELGAEGRYLMDSIDRLSRSYRQAVYLKYAEGLAPLEIGKALGIKENAASVRVHRGLRELRRLTGYGSSPASR